jgi:hypothetical protein
LTIEVHGLPIGGKPVGQSLVPMEFVTRLVVRSGRIVSWLTQGN